MTQHYTPQDLEYMRLAISEARKCTPIETAYNVGAVIVSPDKSQILSTGYSRQLPGNTHAEQCALAALTDIEIAHGATMYTTMEPCSKRLSGNAPCVQRILDAGISTVYVGVLEPPNFVACTGAGDLEKHGVHVVQITEVEGECRELNSHLTK